MTELMSESIGENQKFLICQIDVSEILRGVSYNCNRFMYIFLIIWEKAQCHLALKSLF